MFSEIYYNVWLALNPDKEKSDSFDIVCRYALGDAYDDN